MKSIFALLFASLTAVVALSAMPATARADELFVSNEGQIFEYDATTGAPLNGPGFPLGATGIASVPDDLAVSGNEVFGVNDYTGTIGEYTTSGVLINAALVTGLPLESGYSIAASGGDLFVTGVLGGGTIGEYDATTGATINAALVTGLNYPTDIAVSGDNLFVTNAAGTVGEYTTGGATVNASLVTGLSNPDGIAVSGGNLFVAEDTTGTIGKYDATTGATINAALVTGLAGGVSYNGEGLGGIAVSGGDLFVTNRGGGLYYSGSIGEYDATTGATINASLVTGLELPGGIVVVPTPEPSTWVMFVIGGGTLLACGIRKRRSQEGH